MLISLLYLIQKYNIQFKGILHVGAHECEELPEYENFITRNKILWIEALEDKVVMMKEKYPGLLIENAVVSDKEETVTFNRSNNGQSSSFLQLGLHKIFHPHVWYVNSYQTTTTPLREIIKKYNFCNDINFINFDIQGAELKALKGMDNYLCNVEYIYTEVNSDYVYEGCAIIGEIDEYLHSFGFIRVETSWCEDFRWGDAFYIRNKNYDWMGEVF